MSVSKSEIDYGINQAVKTGSFLYVGFRTFKYLWWEILIASGAITVFLYANKYIQQWIPMLIGSILLISILLLFKYTAILMSTIFSLFWGAVASAIDYEYYINYKHPPQWATIITIGSVVIAVSLLFHYFILRYLYYIKNLIINK